MGHIKKGTSYLHLLVEDDGDTRHNTAARNKSLHSGLLGDSEEDGEEKVRGQAGDLCLRALVCPHGVADSDNGPRGEVHIFPIPVRIEREVSNPGERLRGEVEGDTVLSTPSFVQWSCGSTS